MKADKTKTHLKRKLVAAIWLIGKNLAGSAQADVTLGMIRSMTGPAATLGKPAENVVRIWPDQIGGKKVQLVMVNADSDATEVSKLAS